MNLVHRCTSCRSALLALALTATGCQACARDTAQLRDRPAPAPRAQDGGRTTPENVSVELPRATTEVAHAEPPPLLRISEVLFDPLLLDEGAGEYLELVNLSKRSVRLAEIVVVLPTGRRVSPERPHLPWLRRGEVALARGHGRHPDLALKGLRLPNTAGRVELWWRGQQIDVAQWVVPRRRSRPGAAWERRDPRIDGSLPAAWRLATDPVHGAERGSPGAVVWPCDALVATALESACDRSTTPPGRPRRKNAKGRNLCNSGPAVGRWGGT
ncbi:MAG: hypothetical protein FJ100_03150 [Deltaproteobacteria bacterium]|nr:hypothetical protein [Deltaproteobacteria bacterium]